MKSRNLIAGTLFMSLPAGLFAAGEGKNAFPELTYEHVLVASIAVLLFLVAMLLMLMRGMLRVMKVTKEREAGPGKATVPETDEKSGWGWITGLKPLSKEKDLILEHEYDGIQELNNPTPPWFNLLFYGSIAAAIAYMVYYHMIGSGNVMEEEYSAEMQQAEEKKKEFQLAQGNSIDETNATLITDAAQLGEAKTLFGEKCQACHGDKGQGTGIAPNLTDEYWLHGGGVKDVFKTIKYGVPEKGMISWQNQLKPEQIQNLASYIKSIAGTVPEGEGKAPQGEKFVEVQQNDSTAKGS